MKAVDTQEHLMTNHIIEQLNELNYYDIAGKSQRELISILARLRALEVDVQSDENKWF
ncbi:hypothetical protein [Virgibacillus alimentarius]|uniref:hypothetical protein n=1 Tax=Virgibacillus alimentarius TaxID=698769 RepID=UPI000A659564|nr:hypothetical protein [Virgibacillus alimentarius]